MKIGEAIKESIEKSKEAGKKVKEYLVDDTAKDVKKLLEVNPKAKICCNDCGEKLTKHEKDACIQNEIPPICFGCAIKKKKVSHSHLESFSEGGDGLLYCAKCNAWHKGDINWDNHE